MFEPFPEHRFSVLHLAEEWVFLSVGLVLEIVLMAMDQCASRNKPGYSLVAVVASFATVLICLIELSYKGVKQGVRIKWHGMLFGFHYPASSSSSSSSSMQRPFYSFADIFGLLSAITQFILSLVAYGFYRRHADNPIKLSLVSLIFVLCMAYSRLAARSGSNDEHVRDLHV